MTLFEIAEYLDLKCEKDIEITALNGLKDALGLFNGDFEKFLDSMGVKYQKDLLGPNRYQLLQDGKIKWEDLIDKNGNLRLLKKDKDGNYVGLN